MKLAKLMLIIVFLGYGCKSNLQKDNDFRKKLIGTWTNLSMKVRFLEKDSVFTVPEGKWEDILKIKPIKTEYFPSGRYESSYYGLNDSLLFTTIGYWKLSRDTLRLSDGGNITTYQFLPNLPRATFIGKLDWDQDGKKMEIYEGVQIKE